MFKRLLKRLKRAFIVILALVGILLIIMTIINTRKFFSKNEAIELIIDMDTGVSPDKAFALTRALVSKEINVIAITSAQWQIHPDTPENSVLINQKINDKILQLLQMSDIPSLGGAEDQLSYWGDPKPLRSEASDYIINTVKKLRKGQKVNILCLGPMTNLASALLLDPSIASGIRAYVLGARYDSRSGAWNKNEFNVRNDPDAFDILLNNRYLELFVMPANTASELVITMQTLKSQLQGSSEIFEYLFMQVQEKFSDNEEISMPSLGLMEALANPKYAKYRSVMAPPENFRRKLMVYTFINNEQMVSSFLTSLKTNN